MAKINSKDKGSTFERTTAKSMRMKLGYKDCATSRLMSRIMDDGGVDLVNTGIFYVQCKAEERAVYPHNIIPAMISDGHINVLFHKKNYKGTMVSMSEEDFYKIVKLIPRKRR